MSPQVLSEEEINSYQHNGFIVPRVRLTSQEHGELVSAWRQMLQELPGLDANFVPSPHIPEYTPGVSNSAPWLKFAALPVVLDVVSELIGPDFLMWGSAAFGKPAHDGKATPMHQDGEYWPIRPLASVTVWLAIDESTRINGCLRMVPGSHRHKHLYAHARDDSPELTLNQTLNDDSVDLNSAVDIELEPGQFSVHDVYLVHGSNPNRSGKARAGLTYRYMPTTSHFDHDWAGEMARAKGVTDMSQRTLYLMRGCDRCGKNDFSRGAATRLPMPAG